MPCHICGRQQSDPKRGEAPFHAGVKDGAQVLTCPDCQSSEPGFPGNLDRCEKCGSDRLSLTLGLVRCRACGNVAGEHGSENWLDG